MSAISQETTKPPQESYGRLFLRFLRFGFLAWGGPVAQIAMIRQEFAFWWAGYMKMAIVRQEINNHNIWGH